MPESYGKRQRSRVRAEKAAAKEGRRQARQERQRDRAAGNIREDSWLAPAPGDETEGARYTIDPKSEPQAPQEGPSGDGGDTGRSDPD